MTAVSKYLQEPLTSVDCTQLAFHPGVTCFHSFMRDIYGFGVIALKHFFPLLVTPLLLNFKTMDREIFLNAIKHYLQTCVFTSGSISVSLFNICLIRRHLGTYGKWCFFLGPLIGMQLSWLAPKRTLRLFVIATTQAIVETFLRQNANVRRMLASNVVKTLIFMLNSAIILYYKQTQRYNGFWFIQTPRGTKQDANLHEEPQLKATAVPASTDRIQYKRIWETLKPYVIIGMCLDAVQNVIKMRRIGRNAGLWTKIKSINASTTAFLASYAGIHRLSLHLLAKRFGNHGVGRQQLLAGFLGGAAFIFLNTIQLFTFSLVMTVQILWQQFCQLPSNGRNPNSVLEILKRVPFGAIIFPISQGYLVHHYMVFGSKTLSSLGINLLNALTDNRPRRVEEYFRDRTVEMLMEEANKITPKGVFF